MNIGHILIGPTVKNVKEMFISAENEKEQKMKEQFAEYPLAPMQMDLYSS